MASTDDEDVFTGGLQYSRYHSGKAGTLPLFGIKTRLSGSDLLKSHQHRRQSSLDIGSPTACPTYSSFRIPAFRSRSRSSSVSSSSAGDPLSWFRPSHRASYACRF